MSRVGGALVILGLVLLVAGVVVLRGEQSRAQSWEESACVVRAVMAQPLDGDRFDVAVEVEHLGEAFVLRPLEGAVPRARGEAMMSAYRTGESAPCFITADGEVVLSRAFSPDRRLVFGGLLSLLMGVVWLLVSGVRREKTGGHVAES